MHDGESRHSAIVHYFGDGQMHWRQVGPWRGGRSVAVAGDPRNREIFYFGACAGGIWKTTDAGLYWRCVSDGYLATSSIGALEVANAEPNMIWAGTGESCVRNNVVQGDGIYLSRDAGRTWRHRGLRESRHIARIRSDPRDAATVFVAVLGDIFGPSEERGVYRSRNAGDEFERVLFVNDETGAADLVVDQANPDIVYASMWSALRRPWEMRSGGAGSGLFRSDDGGETWSKLHDRPGFATGMLGRIGVAASPSRAGRLWALVEAEESALYRSENFGDSWTRVSNDVRLTKRPWYYSHIVADPLDGDTIYCLNTSAFRSSDAGVTFREIQTPHGDNHDLWIDPQDSARMIEGNDGGACVSFNRGETWSSIYNQSTAQIYRFDIARKFPFDLFATQQDNSGVAVPSRSWKGAIRWWDCTELGEAEAGDVACDPTDERFIYLGGAGFGHPGPILCVDRLTEQARDVAVLPEFFAGRPTSELTHRFGWTFPIDCSLHEPGVIYAGGEALFRSEDRGESWRQISPDLTRADLALMGSRGGPLTLETAGAEIYCTLYAFGESPLARGELWVGSDDGLVHLSRDNGAEWRDVTPADLPEFATIASIEVSPHRPGTAYVAAHRYRLQDRQPYVFRTEDFGETWDRIGEGFGVGAFVRVVRVDPLCDCLLFAGTEQGVCVSVDDGATWWALQENLPPVPVYDLKIRANELVVGTHGRGLWVLDDIEPLRSRARGASERASQLYKPAVAYRYPTPCGFDFSGEGIWAGGFPGVPLGGAALSHEVGSDGHRHVVLLEGGENPPNGVCIWYAVGPDKAGEDVAIRVNDRAGSLLWEQPHPGGADGARPSGQVGLHSVIWDLRIAAPAGFEISSGGAAIGAGSGAPAGPRVPPGQYNIELSIGPETQSVVLDVLRDPRSSSTDEDLVAQYELLKKVRDHLSRAGEMAAGMESLERQTEAWLSRPDLLDTARDATRELSERVALLRSRLLGVSEECASKGATAPENSVVGRLRQLVEIVIELSDTRPTLGTVEVASHILGELEEISQAWHALVRTDLPACNHLLETLPSLGPERPIFS